MSAERSPWHNARELCLFAGVAALLLAMVYQWTAPEIARQQQRQARQALTTITRLPADAMRIRDASINGEALGFAGEVAYRQVYDQRGDLQALALPLRTLDGYNGRIDLLIGLSPLGEVLGVTVTEHNETPGLADGIERRRSDWITQFNGHAADRPPQGAWTVSRDGGEFDQLTGATITSRAIARTIGEALHSGAVLSALDQAPATLPATEEAHP